MGGFKEDYAPPPRLQKKFEYTYLTYIKQYRNLCDDAYFFT